MDKKELEFLYRQYINGLADTKQFETWMSSIKNDDLTPMIDQIVEQSYYDIETADLVDIEPLRAAEIFQAILSRNPSVKNKVRIWWSAVSSIAAAAVLVGAIIFFRFGADNSAMLVENSAATIHPGTSGATLTLNNGKQIVLSGAPQGILARQGAVEIAKNAKGQIIYSPTEYDQRINMQNTLSTANGQTYQLRLPDQTLVYLNAASSITYPASFAGSAYRTIHLKGEAYFEVAKDKKHPFIVKTDHQEVQVLGTHFNLNAYADMAETTTTLIEGSVAVYLNSRKNPTVPGAILKPSEQAVYNGSSINIREVETSDAVAWKNGYFMFSNERFERVMLSLSRWYNTRVNYEDSSLKDELIYAKLNRYDNLSKLLIMIEKTGKVKFSVYGNTITVSRKKQE